MKDNKDHDYIEFYSEIRKFIEQLLFEPGSKDQYFLNGFSQLEQLARENRPEIDPDLLHQAVCEVYNDLFRERLIVIDPVRGFHIFSVSPKCVRRYKKRHLRPGRFLQAR